MDPVTAHQQVTGGLAAVREPGRHPPAVVADSDQPLGELDGHAVLDRLLAQDPVERPPFDQQQLLGVAAEAPALMIHELDARRRRAGGVNLATDAQGLEDRPPVRRQIEEGTGLVLRPGPTLEDRRLHTRLAQEHPQHGTRDATTDDQHPWRVHGSFRSPAPVSR